MTASQIADMANRAEAEILKSMSAEMREWYVNLPRERRVQIAQDAFASVAEHIA